MPDFPERVSYEVRILIHVDRELTDDEQRAIGDEADSTKEYIADALCDAVYNAASFSIESHGPRQVIA